MACITPNELPRRASNYRRFTIVGGGKTAMDAGVWLLDHGADPDSIRWIVSRDSWLINRASTQRGPEFFFPVIGGVADQMEASAAATSPEDLFERLERKGVMLRIDPSVTPSMFHYATISEGEVSQLRRINNVIRQGHVARLEADQIVMRNGETVSADPDTLYIDCTATAVDFSSGTKPVFEQDRITIQSIYSPLVTMSASLIGYVEANYQTDEEKNQLCSPNILADTPAQWMQSFAGNLMRQYVWSQDKELNSWLNKNRLCPFGKGIDSSVKEDPEKAAVLNRINEAAMPAAQNLQKLISEAC